MAGAAQMSVLTEKEHQLIKRHYTGGGWGWGAGGGDMSATKDIEYIKYTDY